MKSLNSHTAAGLLTLLLVLSTAEVSLAQGAGSTNHLQGPPIQGGADGPNYVPSEVLVKFRNDVTDEQLGQAFRGASLRMLKHIVTGPLRQKKDIGIVRASTTMPVEQAVSFLNRQPGIEYAEPNWVYTHQAPPDDPYFISGNLWGMYGDASDPSNPYGSQAAEAWAAGCTGSRSVVIGVIDEGIQFTHPDLAANIWTNPWEVVGDGIDNDGDGCVDDVHGWNFYQDNNTIYDPGADLHGTHVAGTIGAVGGNGAGVAGVNWEVSIISGKFLGPWGGNTADAAQAVDYFTDLKARGANIVALNNSWGGGGYSQALHDAIIRAAKAGILFVAAAGNGNAAGRAINNDSTPYYPACYNTTVGTSTETAASYDAVISVTAIDSAGSKASWANYGAKTVDLGAPGVGVLSTLPVDVYGYGDGTSMATPHVTGSVALYASTHPGATAPEIKNAILGATIPTVSLARKTVTGGRLDLSTVVTPPNAPDAPAGLTAVPADTYVTVSWNPSKAAAWYDVYRDGSKITRVTSTAYIDDGLTYRSSCAYFVIAGNVIGESPASFPINVTVEAETVPAAPSNLSAEALSKSEVRLTWVDNSGNENSFLITRTGGTEGTMQITRDRNTTAFTDRGLSPMTSYTYRLTATNSQGTTSEITAQTTTWPLCSAAFQATDKATQGTWNGVYGAFGYHIYRFNPPGTYVSGLGASASLAGASPNWWQADGTTDPRALEVPNSTTRFADCWYSMTSFTVDLNLRQPARVSLYFLDWDTTARAQTIEITDPDNPSIPLDAQALSDFRNGTYLGWDIAGRVRITVTHTDGDNAVLSGIFFDDPLDPPTPLPPPPPAPTGLTAQAVSKSQINLSWSYSGTAATFSIERSTVANVGFAEIAGGLNSTTYSDTVGLAANTTYYYRVRAVTDRSSSGYSNTVSARTPRK
jgi:subtilisin family serine protease